MKCIDCKDFKILYEPFGYEWGKAKCERYNLCVDFRSKHKLNRLTHEQGRGVAEQVALKSGEPLQKTQ